MKCLRVVSWPGTGPAVMFPAAFRRSDGKLLWWNWRGDSKERSNIEVQHVGGPNLALGGGLLFLGGPNRLTGTSHPFVAVDAKTGRFWGADYPALFKKAGRDKPGKTVIVKRAMWGTKPIRFGDGMAPVAVDGGIFTFGYRGAFRDLSRYLQTQWGAKPANMDKWACRPPAAPVTERASSGGISLDRNRFGQYTYGARVGERLLMYSKARKGGGAQCSSRKEYRYVCAHVCSLLRPTPS